MRTQNPVAKGLDPIQMAFLNALAGPESGGKYNIRYTPQGGATFDDLSRHPGIFEKGPHGPSSAAGRYQFTKTTWDSLGGGDFSPENQDRRAWELATRDYRSRTGRDLYADLAKDGLSSEEISGLGATWHGLKDNPKKARDWYNRTLEGNGAPSTLPDNYQAMPAEGPVRGPSQADTLSYLPFSEQNRISANSQPQDRYAQLFDLGAGLRDDAGPQYSMGATREALSGGVPVNPSRGTSIQWPEWNLPEPGPNFSVVRNALLALPQQLAEGPPPSVLGQQAGNYVGQAIKDLFWTAEGDLDRQAAEAAANAPAAMGSNPEQDALLAALAGRSGTDGGPNANANVGPSSGQPGMVQTGIPMPTIPAPFQQSPYEIPPAPQLEAPLPQPEIQMPDYGALLAEREQYAPQPVAPFQLPAAPTLVAPDMSAARAQLESTNPDAEPFSPWKSGANFNSLAAALAAGATGKPGDMFGNAGGTLSRANGEVWTAQKKDELYREGQERDYALRMADFEGGIATTGANITNQNANRRYEVDSNNARSVYETENANRQAQREWGLGGLDFKRGVLDQQAEVGNKNAIIRQGNENTQRQFRNETAATEYERQQSNTRNAFETAQVNAKALYDDQIARQELLAPKVLKSDKNGLVIQRTYTGEDGQPYMGFEVKQWGSGPDYTKEELDDLKATEGAFGASSPTTQLKKYGILFRNKDSYGIRHEIIKDSMGNGVLDSVLGDKAAEYKSQAEDLLTSRGIVPGSKEYGDAYTQTMTDLVARDINIADPAVIRALAAGGNVGAQLLLQQAGLK